MLANLILCYFMLNTQEVGVNMANLSFELCTGSDGSGTVKTVNFANLSDQSSLRGVSVTMDVGDVDGEYFMCIRLKALKTSGAWPSVTVGGTGCYITGK